MKTDKKTKKIMPTIAVILLIGTVLIGCTTGANMEPIHENITQATSTAEAASNTEALADESEETIISGTAAREKTEADNTVILLDVRRQDEFDEHSIPGSILIPYDSLESRLSELPDKDAEIIVFCRAGRRSAIAADILISNGYTNVFDMGSISNWS